MLALTRRPLLSVAIAMLLAGTSVAQTPSTPPDAVTDPPCQVTTIYPPSDVEPPRPPGFFVNAEVVIVEPHFKNLINGTVTLSNGVREPVSVPGVAFGDTVSPKIELGYRFANDLGSAVFGYRRLALATNTDLTDGEVVAMVNNWGRLRSRLDLNQFDFDYRSKDLAAPFGFGLAGRAGVRLATVFYDSRAIVGTSPEQFYRSDGYYGAKASTFFIGAGPHAKLEANHAILPHLGIFANAEGAVLFGGVHQTFEKELLGSARGVAVLGASEESGMQVVPTLTVQGGLCWTPMGPDHFRMSLGYQYEYWWMVGRLGSSRGDLTSQGVFVRGEFPF
jgi:hypothetical protein